VRTKGRPHAARDLHALEALYLREHTRLVRLAYLLIGDRSLADDIAQEAFARLIRSPSDVREPAGYLTTVVVNLCRDHHRRTATAARHATRPAAPDEPVLPRSVEAIWLAVQELPDAQREVVVLRYWADLTTPAIAELLGCPAGTVRSLLSRSAAALKEVLSDDR
jgi:RNA polymerase sigma factor (sigma-70 family)